MQKGRVEAFSDGVLAIVITIMVLEIKVPHGVELKDLNEILPVFISYVISFIYLGIYWNNHHHLMHTVTHVTAGILWANLHLLFWLSLIPFVTGWVGENEFASIPMALYGFVLLMSGIAYTILQLTIIRSQGEESVLKKSIGSDFKAKISLSLYFISIITAFYQVWISGTLIIIVALIWFIPDRRIERTIKELGNE